MDIIKELYKEKMAKLPPRKRAFDKIMDKLPQAFIYSEGEADSYQGFGYQAVKVNQYNNEVYGVEFARYALIDKMGSGYIRSD